jgi:hypothetical protein
VFLCIFWGRGRSFQAPSVRAPAFNQVFLIGRQVALETHFRKAGNNFPTSSGECRHYLAGYDRILVYQPLWHARWCLWTNFPLERKKVHALGV